MLPPDDPARDITVARPNADSSLPHVAVVGDVYTILLTGEQTAGRYALKNMQTGDQENVSAAEIPKRIAIRSDRRGELRAEEYADR